MIPKQTAIRELQNLASPYRRPPHDHDEEFEKLERRIKDRESALLRRDKSLKEMKQKVRNLRSSRDRSIKARKRRANELRKSLVAFGWTEKLHAKVCKLLGYRDLGT